MKTYQFEFRHDDDGLGGADLVVDITAERRTDAVGMMLILAADWDSCDNPVTVEVDDTPAVYARAWINLKRDAITEGCIINEWEEENT